MRRPFREEIDQLYREAPRKYDLARNLEEYGIGGGQDWIAITYLLQEIDHLEKTLFEQCATTGQHFPTLIDRRSMAEMGEVQLGLILEKYPSAI